MKELAGFKVGDKVSHKVGIHTYIGEVVRLVLDSPEGGYVAVKCEDASSLDHFFTDTPPLYTTKHVSQLTKVGPTEITRYFIRREKFGGKIDSVFLRPPKIYDNPEEAQAKADSLNWDHGAHYYYSVEAITFSVG